MSDVDPMRRQFTGQRESRGTIDSEPEVGQEITPNKPDPMLDPDAIAANYWSVLSQPRSAWTSEMEM